MGRTVEMLRKVKYMTSRQMRPKTYWYIMGKLRPVPAVTSSFDSIDECMASGERIVALFEKLEVLAPDIATLHIGSGLGRVEAHLRHRVRECVGVDISSSMVKRASALVPYDNVRFVETDGTGLSQWPEKSFDLIYSFLVFQHLPREQVRRYLAESRVKLKDQGFIVFQMLIDEVGMNRDPPLNHPYGLRHYRRGDVEALIEGAGLTLVARTDLDGVADDGLTMRGDVVFCAVNM